MKKDVLHYLKVGGILCAIGAGSALLIGLTNVLTEGPIKKNQEANEQKALKNIYSKDDVDFGEKTDIKEDSKEYKYLLSYWNPTKKGETADETYGYIFKTHGADKNNYGTVTMLVEITTKFEVGKISIVENTESYATTVQNDYVDKYNKGEIGLNDVNCGATYGATLIKEMSEAAKNYCVSNFGEAK